MSFEVIASEEGDGPRRARSARNKRAPLLTVDQIDSVRSKSSCDALVKRVNAGGIKNRFLYDWPDENDKWFAHHGTVRAIWDPSENKCRIFFDYPGPDEKPIFVAFSGEGSLAQFSKDSERNFTWINGEPAWFTHAMRRAEQEEATLDEAAEAMTALYKLESALDERKRKASEMSPPTNSETTRETSKKEKSPVPAAPDTDAGSEAPPTAGNDLLSRFVNNLQFIDEDDDVEDAPKTLEKRPTSYHRRKNYKPKRETDASVPYPP